MLDCLVLNTSKKLCPFSTDTFQTKLDGVDYALLGQPLSQHYVSDAIECFRKCRDDSQCLSFNFQYTSALPSRKCELHAITKSLDPKNFVKKLGYTYYESEG